MVFIMILTVLFFSVSPVFASHYIYKTDDLSIDGFTTRPVLNLPGYGYLETDAMVPQWPNPDGCSSGRPEWSRVDQHPNPTSLVLKSGLLFFRCELVFSADDVDAIVDQRSKVLCDSLPQPDPLLTQLLADIDRLCAADSTDQDCIDARTAYTAVQTARARTSTDDPAEAKRVTEAIQTLHTEAATFKSAQGW